jgi:predicted O-linked N-acetylglucosamine transferase (SPINDLY family)
LNITKSVHNARERLRELEIHTAIWVSVPIFANYALAVKMAPMQVFWSLKFHGVYVPEADLHVCDGHESEEFRTYHGNKWTVSPFPLTVALSDNSAEELAAFRSKFPKDALLLGSLAREEKIASPAFLSVVCQILKQNPHAHYLWTGRQQPPLVVSAFKEAGVADRCHFIGWVNTNLVAEILDIFLDTFPFGCGLTGFQAMGHGTPGLVVDGVGYSFWNPPFWQQKSKSVGA